MWNYGDEVMIDESTRGKGLGVEMGLRLDIWERRGEERHACMIPLLNRHACGTLLLPVVR